MSEEEKSGTANHANPANAREELAPLANLAGGADNTAENSTVGRPFKKGQSGNPAGRPKGARSKLSEVFLTTLAEDFETHGKEAIEALRLSDPKAYLQIIAVATAKVPLAEVKVNNNTLVDQSKVMVVVNHGTDEEWEAKLKAQQQRLTDDAKS